MRRAAWIALMTGITWPLACHLVTEADEFSIGTSAASAGGGSQGAAGAGGSLTGVPTSASTGTPTGSGGAGGAGGTISTGGSGGPILCDGQGNCPACEECVVQPGELCHDVDQACMASPACQSFASCFWNCSMSLSCIGGCISSNYNGAQLYLDRIQCLWCDACPNDCGHMPPTGDFCTW